MGIEFRDTQISDFSELRGTETTTGGIAIKENKKLNDLNGLHGLRALGPFLRFYKNPALDQCRALELPKKFEEFTAPVTLIEHNLGPDVPDCNRRIT